VNAAAPASKTAEEPAPGLRGRHVHRHRTRICRRRAAYRVVREPQIGQHHPDGLLERSQEEEGIKQEDGDQKQQAMDQADFVDCLNAGYGIRSG